MRKWCCDILLLLIVVLYMISIRFFSALISSAVVYLLAGCFLQAVLLEEDDYGDLDHLPSADTIFLPCEVVLSSTTSSGLVKVTLHYRNRGLTRTELVNAQLLDPDATSSHSTSHVTSLRCLGVSFQSTGTSIDNLQVVSAFALPQRINYIRLYRYGFAKSDRLVERRQKPLSTKEYGLTGVYTRPYVRLVCMGSGSHVLDFFGTEMGIHRVNSDYAIGREVCDLYAQHISEFTMTFTALEAILRHTWNHWRTQGCLKSNATTLAFSCYSFLATIFQVTSTHHHSTKNRLLYYNTVLLQHDTMRLGCRSSSPDGCASLNLVCDGTATTLRSTLTAPTNGYQVWMAPCVCLLLLHE